ncbi:MAG: hypothetical protein ACK5ZD_02260, partial [Hyphomonadaceae bacterium]
MSNAEAPPPFEGEAKALAAANPAGKAGEGPADEESGAPKKMINGAAPVGAPRVQVDVFEAKEFTRLRLSRVGNQFPLPAHGYARRGDRLAIAIPGRFAFDTAAIRNRPPERVLDAARYNSDTDSSFLLDVAPNSVVRHSRDGNAIVIDIMPEGANPNTIQALQEEAGGKIGSPAPKSVAGKQAAKGEAKAGEATEAPPNPEAMSEEAKASELDAEALLAQRPDPAPTGRVRMSSALIGKELQLEFDFEAPAPAAMYRRGDSIYVLFATAADMDVGRVPSGKFLSRIEKVRGDGVSGIRIVAPPEVQATPTSLGSKWKVVLSPQKQATGRSIGLVREQALDGTSRVKALVPDGAATGMITDPAVGDTLLIGLALGPNSSLGTQRSYLEAVLPETFHGLVVVPRTDDFALRRDVDGFVLVRPQGMALSGLAPSDDVGAGPATAPGFIDFNSWRLGPKIDFTNNLNKLRRKAALELGDSNNRITSRVD